MIGLMFLLAFGIYLAISVWVVKATVGWARKNGRGVKRWGFTAALFMYLLVFWDHIPVLVKHHNLCKQEGGFWIYKTPEQWFKENPDAIGKKWGDERNDLRYGNIKGISRAWLSDYVYLETYYNQNYAHAIRKYESRLVDARTGEVLARMVDFERGGGNLMLRSDSIIDYKFWLGMGKNTCGVDAFGQAVQQFKRLGRAGK